MKNIMNAINTLAGTSMTEEQFAPLWDLALAHAASMHKAIRDGSHDEARHHFAALYRAANVQDERSEFVLVCMQRAAYLAHPNKGALQ